MLNIVLPIAGRGRRFTEQGYALPKPLIPVHGVPMIEVVVNNVRPRTPHRWIFLALAEHLAHTGMRETLARIAPGAAIVPVDRVTEGAACTMLLARDCIDSAEPLMIANSDQYVDADINEYLAELERRALDGLIMTFWSDHPKWSYCRVDSRGRVTEVVEKTVVSHDATVGIYNYARGRDFVRAAERMIALNLRVNNEFYVAPTYNQLLREGANIGVWNIGREYETMHGLGIPADLAAFEARREYAGPIRAQAARGAG